MFFIQWSRLGVYSVFLICALSAASLRMAYAEDVDQKKAMTEAPANILSLQGEILEIEILRDPSASAVLKVKDYATGKTLDMFADGYRATVRMGGENMSIADVLPGSKVTILYEKGEAGGRAQIVFLKVTHTL